MFYYLAQTACSQENAQHCVLKHTVCKTVPSIQMICLQERVIVQITLKSQPYGVQCTRTGTETCKLNFTLTVFKKHSLDFEPIVVEALDPCGWSFLKLLLAHYVTNLQADIFIQGVKQYAFWSALYT